jgi:hypothetical protein
MFCPNRKRFASLAEQEILALAISSEEDDARIYRRFSANLCPAYEVSAQIFDAMATEEDSHRQTLIDLHIARFGSTIPLIRREHVVGFYSHRPLWLAQTLSLKAIRAPATIKTLPSLPLDAAVLFCWVKVRIWARAPTRMTSGLPRSIPSFIST